MTAPKNEGTPPANRPGDKAGAANVPPAKPGATGSSAVKPEAVPSAPAKPEAAEPAKSGTTGSSAVRPDAPKADFGRTEPAKPGTPGARAGEPPKPAGAVGAAASAAKPDPLKADALKSDPLKSEPSKPEPLKSEPLKSDAPKTEALKGDTFKAGSASGSGPQSTSRVRVGEPITDGPIIDLKAKRIPDPADAAKGMDRSKDRVATAAGTPDRADAPKAGGPAPRIAPGATEAPSRGPGFGAVAGSALLGGLVGAGLMLAVDQFGLLGGGGGDARLSALDQRIGTLATREAVAGLDKRVAANEAAAKAASERAGEALQKAAAAPVPTPDGAAAPAPAAPAVPADLVARLDSLDQRVSALQEEPGREQPAAPTTTQGSDATAALAALDERLKAVEVGGEARPAGGDSGQAFAALRSDIEKRAGANEAADQALGQRLDALQQAVDARVKTATEAAQAATEASRQAAEAGKAQAGETAKTIEGKLQEQGERIAGLDKAVAERADTATVRTALRIVTTDRIATALAMGAPYGEALASLRGLESGDPAKLSALAAFADTGAPTAASLAAEFRPIADKIAASRRAAQARNVAESGDLTQRLMSMAESIVQVRRVDGAAPAEAGTPDVSTAKVQQALDRGAIAEAAEAFAALPEEVRAQAGNFGTRLKTKAEAERATQALLSDAFSGLQKPAPDAGR